MARLRTAYRVPFSSVPVHIVHFHDLAVSNRSEPTPIMGTPPRWQSILHWYTHLTPLELVPPGLHTFGSIHTAPLAVFFLIAVNGQRPAQGGFLQCQQTAVSSPASGLGT